MAGSESAKEAAGRRAAEEVADGMTLGLGTGSTVHFFLVRLGERIEKDGLKVHGVPTSEETARTAERLGIPLTDLFERDTLDLYVDGADEVDPAFRLIKGGGGALLHEKIVASASRLRIIVVDPSKLVDQLGMKMPVPLEVIPFARPLVNKALTAVGGEGRLRRNEEGQPYRTREGNDILDCRFPNGVADPAGLERLLSLIPGVVESGLFVGLAEKVIVGKPDGTVEIRDRGGHRDR